MQPAEQASPRGSPSARSVPKAERKTKREKREQRAAVAAAAADAADAAAADAPPTEATAVHISAAEVPAEAAAAAVASPRADVRSPRHSIIDIHSARGSAASSAAGSSDASGLSPRADGGAEGEGESSTAPSSRIRAAARLVAIPFIQLAIWLSHIWALLAGALLVAPLRLVRAPARAVRCARAVAQRPLIAVSVALAPPVYLDDVSYGVDFSALPGQRAATMHDLIGQVRTRSREHTQKHTLSRMSNAWDVLRFLFSFFLCPQLKPRSRARWNERTRRARRSMESAGLTVSIVTADAFAPGIEHRRVIWAHICAHNASAGARIVWAAATVSALHTFHAHAVEFRNAASGALVGFSLVIDDGGAYCGAPLYAARPEFARAGLWCVCGTLDAWPDACINAHASVFCAHPFVPIIAG
jgi:hypothetical protein